MGAPSWDGRYGIVVATDVAAYEEGPARPTGGAGAIAILLGSKPKIQFSAIRSSFIDHQYDFYKPNPSKLLVTQTLNILLLMEKSPWNAISML